jgi:hypothetical protein
MESLENQRTKLDLQIEEAKARGNALAQQQNELEAEQVQALRAPQGGANGPAVASPSVLDWLQDANSMQDTVPAVGAMLIQYHKMVDLLAAAIQTAQSATAPLSHKAGKEQAASAVQSHAGGANIAPVGARETRSVSPANKRANTGRVDPECFTATDSVMVKNEQGHALAGKAAAAFDAVVRVNAMELAKFLAKFATAN